MSHATAVDDGNPRVHPDPVVTAPLSSTGVSGAAFAADPQAPERRLRVALSVVGGIGVSALTLFQPPGIGWSLAVVIGVGVFVANARLCGRALSSAERVILALVVTLGAFFTVRTSPWLVGYNLVGIFALALLLPLFARRRASVSRLRPEDLGRELRRTLGGGLASPILDVTGTAEDALGSLDRKETGAVVRGLLFALPVAGLFTALFASADRAFDDLLGALAFDLDGELILRAFTLGGWVMLLLGVLGASRRRRWEPRVRARRSTVSGVAALTVLLVLNGVFGVFVVVQLLQALGLSGALLENPSAISSAAREGFFQLLWVVGLVFVLILGLDRRLPLRERSALVVGAELSLLALTALVAASALVRMHRYTEAFGLTELRVHSTAVMVWLLVALGLAAFTLVRGRRGMFVGPALLSLVAFVIGLDLANPDRLIAEHNQARVEDGTELDVMQLYDLSADALPRHRELRPAEAAAFEGVVDAERELLWNGGWRAYNVARARAWELAWE